MGESNAHKRAKKQAAGGSGRTEVPIKGGQRLDVRTMHKAVEIERSNSSRGLKAAATRLKNSRKSQKVLVVPATSMAKARAAMREVGVSGTVRNISGTKRSYVPKV